MHMSQPSHIITRNQMELGTKLLTRIVAYLIRVLNYVNMRNYYEIYVFSSKQHFVFPIKQCSFIISSPWLCNKHQFYI